MEPFTPSLLAFYLISALVVGLAVLAVTTANLVRAALALALGSFAVAGVFWLLGSPFLAVLQLVVNAGAIPIVTIFIVMMTQSRVSYLRGPMTAVWALVVAVPLAVLVLGFLPGIPMAGPGPGTQAAKVTPLDTEQLGVELLGRRGQNATLSNGKSLRVRGGSSLAFEATALVLLVAFAGAVVLTRREGPSHATRRQPPASRTEVVDADA